MAFGSVALQDAMCCGGVPNGDGVVTECTIVRADAGDAMATGATSRTSCTSGVCGLLPHAPMRLCTDAAATYAAG